MGLLKQLIIISCLALLPGACRAQESPGDASLSPYFFVKSENPATDQLPLKSTTAQVDIAGVIAAVKVTQVYKNEGRRPLEAIYVFPGSTRAAVYAMKMTIGERVIQAKIREKEQARQEYEQAKQEGRSASLLEQQRPNVFQMNVANVLPGDEIQVEMSYTELLIPTAGVYQFVYPTVVGPRYAGVPGTPSATGEKWVANPYTKEGEAPFATFHLEARLNAGMPIQKMICKTHKTDIVYESAEIARLKLDDSEKQGGNRDFVLNYQLAGGQVQSGLLLSKGSEENFFLLMVQPPKRVEPAQIPPREYVFIMDVSGSMNGYPIETSKQLIRDLVSHLRPVDRFNILVFESGSAAWCEKGSQPATPENLEKALAFVGSQNGGGGTELLSALKHAIALPRAEGMSHTFVIATDGYISADYHVLDYLREHLGDANMFAFGIGGSVNRFLIEGMAHAGMGEAFVVERPTEAPALAAKFREYIASPVLTSIKLAFNGFDAYDIEPPHVPDVLADRPIICFGKWRGEAKGTITVDGISGTGAYHQGFAVQASDAREGNAALRYLWARHRIQLLGDYGPRGGAGSRKEITDLGLKYDLLTDFTSFVAIDSLVRNEGGKQGSVKQPLPMPQGVSNLAIAPGVTGPNASVRGSGMSQAMYRIDGINVNNSASTVACCAAACCASDVDEGVSFEKAPKGCEIKVGAIHLDCDAATLVKIHVALQLKMEELAAAGLFEGLRHDIAVKLRIDGTGTVVEVRGVSGKLARELKSRLLAWCIAEWTQSGTISLRVPILVVR